ncbi:HopJ type III effector protein [Rheinheimera mesophila]|nr:HopJ type III effector protein [Rheinheimera mesophila]KKL03046.1 type III effector [Rheinheimera mesophila]
MMLENFFRQLTTEPDSISFSQSIELIESLYQFTETAFRNGTKHNAAGENNGSCKIFAFALLHRLSEPQTLQMFGDYYRKDVLLSPAGADHANIRQFMQYGWDGIEFEGQALSPKSA